MNKLLNKKLKRVLEKSKERVSIEHKMIKLAEEHGEVAQELLKYLNTINSSKSASGKREAAVEELTDMLLVIVDLINHLDGLDLAQEIVVKKIEKWDSKFQG